MSCRRSFVSTVLLARTWESESVLELRKEARARGLSTRGNKSTLVARIKEHEHRAASTNVVPPPHPQKTLQAAAPGIPLAPRSDPPRSGFPATKLPDLSKPPPHAPVQIPYLPDFWDSARPKANPPLESGRPRLHVVSGSATHYDGGPTYNLEKPQEDASPSTAARPTSQDGGFWPDLWESLGLPRSFNPRRTLSEAGHVAARSGKDEFQPQSRPLSDEERRGLYILLGIVGGSWLAGGLVNRQTADAEEHDTQSQH